MGFSFAIPGLPTSAPRSVLDGPTAAAIIPHFQPGDLLFFRGDDVLSKAIAYRTCTWRQLFAAPFNGGFLPSHVGVCCDYRESGYESSSRTILVESTTLNERPCYVRDRHVIGVQAHLPRVRVADYPGRVWRLRLRRPLSIEERRCLSSFLLSQLGRPYNYRRAAALGEFFWRRAVATLDPLPDTWFCDELCIEALKCVNRVGVDNDPESFSPATFARLVLHSGEYYGLGGTDHQSPSLRIK